MSPSEYQPVRPSHRPPESWLTVPEIAVLLRVSRMTVYRRIETGELPAHRIGRALRIREKDFDAYLRSTDTSGWEADE